jgi:pimeloyl-ACP methyl ester carboxylesterase
MTTIAASDETPRFFEVDGDRLFGIVTTPRVSNGVGVLIIQGGDTVNVSLLRNRMAVRLARRLSELGYTCFRFDYHGLGESTGVIGELRLSSPFTNDAAAAARVLMEAGVSKILLAGACFSSRTALSTAPELDDVVGIVMATPPIGSYERKEAVAERMARERSVGEYAKLALRPKTLKRLFDKDRRAFYLKLAKKKINQVFRNARATTGGDGGNLWWVSRHFLGPLATMSERRTPVLIAYGVDDPLLREFERAEEGELGRILDKSAGLIEVVRDMPGIIHGFPAVEGQEAFLDLAVDWIEKTASPYKEPSS